jgi:hypothetical protein
VNESNCATSRGVTVTVSAPGAGSAAVLSIVNRVSAAPATGVKYPVTVTPAGIPAKFIAVVPEGNE